LSDLSEKRLAAKLTKLHLEDLSKDIILTNYISNTDLPDVYNLATAFIYPSLRESFGIPILEAMACGTPVITSNCTSMPEVAGDAALLIDPTSPESIASGIHRMMTDENLRDSCIQKGMMQVQRYSWRRSAEKMNHTYQEVLNPVIVGAISS
jgi:glycosyltransferase involved in cell wall biosynthesis